MDIAAPTRHAAAQPAPHPAHAHAEPQRTAEAGVSRHSAAAPRAAQGVLSFSLGDESYALDIHAVREIRSFEPPTRVAGAPAEVLGVVNLRGTVVPVIDLRRRLGMAPRGAGEGSVVIVVEMGTQWVGACVDAVNDVFDLSAHPVNPMPALGEGRSTAHLQGIVTLPDRLLMLLDIVALLGETMAPVATC